MAMVSKRSKPLPSVEFLRERFAYDANTGALTRLEYPGMRKSDATRLVGKSAGHVNKRGYIQVGIGNRLVLAHRIIWKIVTGNEPPPEIDHRDGNTLNNRFDNYRAASHQQNTQNKAVKRGKATPLGVHIGKSGVIEVKVRKERYSGFSSIDDAAEFYRKRSIELFGEFAKLSNSEGADAS